MSEEIIYVVALLLLLAILFYCRRKRLKNAARKPSEQLKEAILTAIYYHENWQH